MLDEVQGLSRDHLNTGEVNDSCTDVFTRVSRIFLFFFFNNHVELTLLFFKFINFYLCFGRFNYCDRDKV